MADQTPGIDFVSNKTFSGLSYRKPILHSERRVRKENLVLKQENIRDSLTGIYNRKYFDDQMKDIQENNLGVGLAIIDIDHFKDVNDLWGHQAGDAVLRGLARKLNEKVREERVGEEYNDVVARYGGEEFVIIFKSNLSAENLEKRCEEIRTDIQSSMFWVSENIKVNRTISVGYALRRDGETAADLIARADRAVYKAKSGGRNQVVMAELANV